MSNNGARHKARPHLDFWNSREEACFCESHRGNVSSVSSKEFQRKQLFMLNTEATTRPLRKLRIVRKEWIPTTNDPSLDRWMDGCMDAIRKGQDTRNTRQTLIRSLSGLKTQSKNTWRNTSEFLAAKTLLLPLLRLRSLKIVVYFLLSGTDWLLLLFFKRTLNFPIEYTRLSPVPTTSIIELQTKITTKTKTRYMKIQGERSVRFEKSEKISVPMNSELNKSAAKKVWTEGRGGTSQWILWTCCSSRIEMCSYVILCMCAFNIQMHVC